MKLFQEIFVKCILSKFFMIWLNIQFSGFVYVSFPILPVENKENIIYTLYLSAQKWKSFTKIFYEKMPECQTSEVSSGYSWVRGLFFW